MECLFREHFEGTMRNVSLSIVGVLHIAVRLSLVGKNDLNVSFGAKSTTLKQRNFAFNTTTVHISPSLDIIEGIGYDR